MTTAVILMMGAIALAGKVTERICERAEMGFMIVLKALELQTNTILHENNICICLDFCKHCKM